MSWTLTIAPEEIRAACSIIQAAGYNFFEDMTAVDWFPASPRFQLRAITFCRMVSKSAYVCACCLKIPIPRSTPSFPSGQGPISLSAKSSTCLELNSRVNS